MIPLPGHHLLLDGQGIRRPPVDDIALFLRLAKAVVGLSRLGPYYNDGSRGMVVVAESHISVHIDGDRVWADVFSCKAFNREAVEDLCVILWPGTWASQLLRRHQDA